MSSQSAHHIVEPITGALRPCARGCPRGESVRSTHKVDFADGRLCVEGMMSIQLFVPTFSIDECLLEIRECLEKGWTGLGFKTVEFEKQWCSYTGLPHSHFINSATSGLHLAATSSKKLMDGRMESNCSGVCHGVMARGVGLIASFIDCRADVPLMRPVAMTEMAAA